VTEGGRTYDLQEAAEYLRMSPAVLRQKAAQGRVKGAKPGKCWVFLERDLVDFLDRLYAATGQAPLSGSKQEIGACRSIDAVQPGGSVSHHPMASEYAALLGLTTSARRRNTTIGSKPSFGNASDSESSLGTVGKKPS
jgi:hypothetical protein